MLGVLMASKSSSSSSSTTTTTMVANAKTKKAKTAAAVTATSKSDGTRETSSSTKTKTTAKTRELCLSSPSRTTRKTTTTGAAASSSPRPKKKGQRRSTSLPPPSPNDPAGTATNSHKKLNPLFDLFGHLRCRQFSSSPTTTITDIRTTTCDRTNSNTSSSSSEEETDHGEKKHHHHHNDKNHHKHNNHKSKEKKNHRKSGDNNNNTPKRTITAAATRARLKLNRHRTSHCLLPVRADQTAVQFLHETCPPDVVRLVLALAGPQTAQALNATNRYFHSLLQQEETWRVLCYELYKWNNYTSNDENEDYYNNNSEQPIIEPESWKEYYRLHPCIPVDFSTINKALKAMAKKDGQELHQLHASLSTKRPHCHRAVATVEGTNDCEEGVTETETDQLHRRSCSSVLLQSNVTLLLRPGRHYITRAIHVEMALPNTRVALQTMQLPPATTRTTSRKHQPLQQPRAVLISSPKRRRSTDCCAHSYAYAADRDNLGGHHRRRCRKQQQVLLINEPLIRVIRGHLVLRDIDLQHSSWGNDIWNGNAALQICPTTEQQQTTPCPQATARLDNCRVTSFSGRGIVCTASTASANNASSNNRTAAAASTQTASSTRLVLHNSCVTDCAATGIYVGGSPATTVSLSQSDVWNNGIGSRHNAASFANPYHPFTTTTTTATIGGNNNNHNHTTTRNNNLAMNALGYNGVTVVSRGHSGIYVEMGQLHVSNCSIAHNTAAGIALLGTTTATTATARRRQPTARRQPPQIPLLMSDSEVLQNGNSPIEWPSSAFLFLAHHGHNDDEDNDNHPQQHQQQQAMMLALEHEQRNRISVFGQVTPRSAPLQWQQQIQLQQQQRLHHDSSDESDDDDDDHPGDDHSEDSDSV